MNLIYSKYSVIHTNTAVLMQKQYQDFRKHQEEERIKSIENTFITNEYTVISG